MGLFNLFKSGEEFSTRSDKGLEWVLLETEEEFEKLKMRSAERPQIIFKNSTACGISGMVLRSFESQYSSARKEADLHLLHIQYNRELSNLVSRSLGIRHESPQLLILRGGEVVAHASHSGITNIDLEEYL